MSWEDESDFLDRESSDRVRARGSFSRHPFQDPKSAIRFLKQDEWWADAGNGRIAISEMDSDYLLATMTHLLRRAPSLKLSIELYYRKNGAKTELVDKLEKMSSEKFMKDTVLFQSLKSVYLSEPEVPDVFD